MALRIGGAKKELPLEEAIPQEEAPIEGEMPEDLMAELPESLEEEPMEAAGGEVDPMTAGYRGPEQGPFACGNCVYFSGQQEGSCAIVAGPIDAAGLCNLFTPAQANTPEEEVIPEEVPLPEEEPQMEAEEVSEEGY